MFFAGGLDLGQVDGVVVGNLVSLTNLDAQHAGQVPGVVASNLRMAVADLIDKKTSSHNDRLQDSKAGILHPRRPAFVGSGLL